MDFLFGLDMLKRHRCNIDLARNTLVLTVNGNPVDAPFLHEHQLDMNKVGLHIHHLENMFIFVFKYISCQFADFMLLYFCVQFFPKGGTRGYDPAAEEARRESEKAAEEAAINESLMSDDASSSSSSSSSSSTSSTPTEPTTTTSEPPPKKPTPESTSSTSASEPAPTTTPAVPSSNPWASAVPSTTTTSPPPAQSSGQLSFDLGALSQSSQANSSGSGSSNNLQQAIAELVAQGHDPTTAAALALQQMMDRA